MAVSVSEPCDVIRAPDMEALGFLKALDNIIVAGINVVVVVTEAHISTTATMSEYWYQFFFVALKNAQKMVKGVKSVI